MLAGTQQTSTTVRLARGHSYTFVVAGLDESGVATATSAPLHLAIAAARSR
jgi:hypothetical protein